MLNLPQIAVLDRFHVARAVHSAFGKLTDSHALLDSIFSQPLDTVKPQLLALISKTRGKQAELLKRCLKYLENNQNALLDLQQYSLPFLKLATLGSAEANVDKHVRQRMRSRGFAWSITGAQAMLAVLRHKDNLSKIVFHQSVATHSQAIPTQKRSLLCINPSPPLCLFFRLQRLPMTGYN